jgi:hypothetical protein
MMTRVEPKKPFPGWQRMLSSADSATILHRHHDHLRHYHATADDCRIENLREIPAHDPVYAQGFRSRFELHWVNYLGWKVGMLHAGCFATIPAWEENGGESQ